MDTCTCTCTCRLASYSTMHTCTCTSSNILVYVHVDCLSTVHVLILKFTTELVKADNVSLMQCLLPGVFLLILMIETALYKGQGDIKGTVTLKVLKSIN